MKDFRKKIIIFFLACILFCFNFYVSKKKYSLTNCEAREILKFDHPNVKENNENNNNENNDKINEEIALDSQNNNTKDDEELEAELEAKKEAETEEKIKKNNERISNELSTREKRIIPIGEIDGDIQAISKEFNRGIHLIYYCIDNHWACVDRKSFDRCKEIREKNKIRRELNLGCAQIKSFATENECILQQRKAIAKTSKKTTEGLCTSIGVDQHL